MSINLKQDSGGHSSHLLLRKGPPLFELSPRSHEGTSFCRLMVSATALLASMMLERVRAIFMVAEVWSFGMTICPYEKRYVINLGLRSQGGDERE